MLTKSTLGIFVKKTKSWYYLEMVNHPISSNSIDRIKRILSAKDIIDYAEPNGETGANFKVLTYEEALDQNLKIEPLFISKHLKNLYDKETENKKSQVGWREE